MKGGKVTAAQWLECKMATSPDLFANSSLIFSARPDPSIIAAPMEVGTCSSLRSLSV